MPSVELDAETVARLDDLRSGESYDEIVTELIDIYEAEELHCFTAATNHAPARDGLPAPVRLQFLLQLLSVRRASRAASSSFECPAPDPLSPSASLTPERRPPPSLRTGTAGTAHRPLIGTVPSRA